MKLLITGAKGQLGSELLRQTNHEAIGVDLPVLDVTKANDFQDCAEAHKPDVIVHCAAMTQVDNCETDPDTAYAVNALGARNAAASADKTGAKLIYVSTDYVFSGQGPSAKREWDIPAPQSVYGATKLAGENYVRQFCKRSFVVRTAWLYGYSGHNFVKTILGSAKQGKTLKVVHDQIGNPTNAVDVAKHLLSLAETEEYGVYHCTSQGECSWYEFADTFLRLSGLAYTITPCTTKEYPRPAKRPAFSSLDNMMLRLTIGDKMPHWQEAIEEYMRHYQKTGEFDG